MSEKLKAGIFSRLSGEATITALVNDRIFPGVADQKTPKPYITYQMDSDQGTHHLSGVSGNKLALTLVQFNIWGNTPDEVSAIETALRDFLEGTIRVNFGSAFVARAWNTNSVDTTEDPKDGSQNEDFGIFSDFNFWHNR